VPVFSRVPLGIDVALSLAEADEGPTKKEKENAMKTKSQIKAGAESVGLPNRKGYIR
jgi:hypothetical protein